MTTSPNCPHCGPPLLEDDGQVKPHVKIKLQADYISELHSQIQTLSRRLEALQKAPERGPSGLDHDDPITAPGRDKP